MTDHRTAAVLAAVLFLTGCARPDVETTPPDNAIIGMLDASAEAWNRGDLEQFVDDYTADATFVGSSGVIHGVDQIEARYRANYWGEDGPPETLRFEDIRVTQLGAEHALAVGRYVLESRDSGEQTATGIFSLVLVRTADGWRIIHDHSSSTD